MVTNQSEGKRSRLLIVGAAIAVTAAGYRVARRFTRTYRLNKMMNGNLSLFKESKSYMTAVERVAKERPYVLRHWPVRSQKDDLKKRLITVAASDGNAEEMEKIRMELLTPPKASKEERVLKEHGDEREDAYYWLRDDERKNPKMLRYLEEENKYTKAVMGDTEALQEDLYKELRGRIQEADVSAPVLNKGFIYYTRTEEGKQYAVHCRKKMKKGWETMDFDGGIESQEQEEVLLDENAESKGHAFYMTAGVDVSPNQKLLAYGVDTVGNEMYTLYVKDLETGKMVLSKPIEATDGSYAWSTDNVTLFYTTKDELDRPYKVWRHRIGTDPKDDVLVYHEKDEAFYLGIGLSRSEKYIYVHAGSAITSDVRFLAADNPEGELNSVMERRNDVEYSVEDRGEQFFITVRDKARFNSEVLVAPVSSPQDATVLLQHRPDVKIEHVEMSRDFMTVFQRSGGLQRIIIYPLSSGNVNPTNFVASNGYEIEFDEPAYELHNGAQGEFDSPYLRYIYTSFTTPSTVVDYNTKKSSKIIRKVQPVIGFDSSKYKSERIWATASDGVKVPISLVYRTDLVKLDGTDPFLLDAYGSYEINNDADFRSSRLTLIDRGFIFGIAHVRGGGEMGRQWYLDGKYLNKKNTFFDFLSCAEYLVNEKYTSAEKLCIQGRSAGGLTMGASINESVKSPKGLHFNCAILGVPFVDVLTTYVYFNIFKLYEY